MGRQKKVLCFAVGVFLISGFASCSKPNQKNTSSIASQDSSSAAVSSVSSEDISEAPVVGFNANMSGVPILLYHHFRLDKYASNNEIITPVSEFDAHLKALKDKGYSTITAQKLIDYLKNGTKIPPKSFVLTFDDAYKSNAALAAPIMRKYGFQGIVFVITGIIDQKNESYNESLSVMQFMSMEDMESCKDVFEYACHSDTAYHRDMRPLPYEQSLADFKLCKEKLNSPYFSYPLGFYDANLIKAVKETGFTAAFTTVRTHAKKGVSLYEIPRYTITTPSSAQRVMNIVENIK